jgi:hypothetical protein
VVLALIVAAGLIGFVAIRPHQEWILWLTVVMAALAADGIVRTHPRWEGEDAVWSLPFLFLPAFATLGAGLFIDHAIEGYARPVTALGCALVVGVVAFGEYHTVDFGSRLFGTMRLILAIATYLTAFALYAVIFSKDINVGLAALAVTAVSFGLALELLRETYLLGPSSILVAFAIGVTMGELRLGLYFFPLDGLLAGALLIIGFYFATGIVHHLLDHDLEIATLAEYVIVGGTGAAAVVVTRLWV